ncbi:hypothetical protein V2G26_014819 [Clonostachys chloroleuca]
MRRVTVIRVRGIALVGLGSTTSQLGLHKAAPTEGLSVSPRARRACLSSSTDQSSLHDVHRWKSAILPTRLLPSASARGNTMKRPRIFNYSRVN